MGQYIFKMPDIGEGVTEAEIVSWHVKVGDPIKEDDPIADAMTDKATVELTAPVDGTVQSLGCEEGDMLAIGADLVVFETKGGAQTAPQSEDKPAISAQPPAPAPAPADKPKQEKPAQNQKALNEAAQDQRLQTPSTDTASKPLASPSVRKRAMDLGIDLSAIRATGKAGQITHEDLDAYVERPANGLQKRTDIRTRKITGMRRVIAERMQVSKQNIPHFSYVEAIDMTELERTRAHLNATRKSAQPKLTPLPFFMRAMVKALASWPQCNATYDDGAGLVSEYGGVHIGMATQTKTGLMVPVIRHAESQTIWQLANEIARLSEGAKTGTITADELSGSTITLTSLGRLAGIMATPVINRPEVAILCPNKIVETPIIENGQMVVRKMMNFSSSFDHRIVDGYDAAQMMAYIKGLLEHPATLFMDEI